VLLRNAAREGRDVLTEEEAKRVLKYYNFPVVPTVTARNAEDAASRAREIGFPVVLKILSPDIVHKSEAGGVLLNIGTEDEVREGFATLTEKARTYRPGARISGVTVQPMVRPHGFELIIGGKTDPLFGPVILFGMGGVGVELFKDFAVGLPPLTTTLIRRMFEETKVYELLKGYRNQPGADLELLERTLLLFSQLLVDFPQIREIDINPLHIDENEVRILDARVAIDKEAALRQHPPHAHLVISPYPKKYENWWTTRKGQEVLLRPIKPEDEPLWLEMFQSFSEESIRYRFFQVIKDTPHEVRVRYCNIDYDREIAIVAELTEGGKRKFLGVCRVSLESDGKSGELAIIITDEYQGAGLGSKIVDYAIEVASDMHVERIYSFMLPDNYRAQALMRKMGFDLESLEDGTVRASLDLTEGPEVGQPPKPKSPPNSTGPESASNHLPKLPENEEPAPATALEPVAERAAGTSGG